MVEYKIRLITDNFIEDMFAYQSCSSPEMKYLTFKAPDTARELEEFTGNIFELHLHYGIYVDGVQVGHIGTIKNKDRVDIGWMLTEKYQGQGIMIDVATRFINNFFAENDDDKLYATIHPDNIGSIALATKLGFVKSNSTIEAKFPQVREKMHVPDHILTKEKWHNTK